MCNYYEILNRGLYALRYGSPQEQRNLILEIKYACSHEEINETSTRFTQKYGSWLYGINISDTNRNLNKYCETLWQKIKKQQQYQTSYNSITFFTTILDNLVGLLQ